MAGKLDQLVELMGLKKLETEQKMRALKEAEEKIRDDLSTIDRMKRDSNDIRPELNVMRGIGADLHWRAWLSRSREESNIELAQVKSRMAPLEATHRRNAGRYIAAGELAKGKGSKDRSKS